MLARLDYELKKRKESVDRLWRLKHLLAPKFAFINNPKIFELKFRIRFKYLIVNYKCSLIHILNTYFSSICYHCQNHLTPLSKVRNWSVTKLWHLSLWVFVPLFIVLTSVLFKNPHNIWYCISRTLFVRCLDVLYILSLTPFQVICC